MNTRPIALLLSLLACAHARAGGVPAADSGNLHQSLTVFDAHCDTVMRIEDPQVDFAVRSEEGHLDLVRMASGGLDVQVFALWIEPRNWPDHAARRTLQLADVMLRTIERHPDRLALALTAADAERIAGEGKTAVILGIEGGHAIEDDLGLLRMFHRLGVRVMTLTWMRHTNWADASGEKPRHGGLTEFGREVVREMNRLGMVIDVSHVADSTFYDVLETTRQPVIASHSCCRALCPHHRNLSDDMLLALKKNGGVIGINYFAGFLDPEASRVVERAWDRLGPVFEKLRNELGEDSEAYRQKRRELVAAYRKEVPLVPLERLIEHIDHAVRVAGVDHVGLGSDFDGISITPVGLDDVSDLPAITAKLAERGYTKEEIAKILGGNLMRVFRRAIGN